MNNDTLILSRASKLCELQEGLALRHKVFVQEKKFEPDYGNGFEFDAKDTQAKHFIFRERETSAPVGYFRILPRKSSHATQVKWLPYIQEWQKEGDFCELSRLLLLKEYRNIKTIHIMFDSIGDLLASMSVSNMYAIMEDALARALIRFGYPIARLTESFDLNGKRSLYLLYPKETFAIAANG